MAKLDNAFLTAEAIVRQEVDKICKSLDEYVDYVLKLLNDDTRDITDVELDYIATTLAVEMYYVGKEVEIIGLKEDIAEFVKKENYDVAFSSADGTVADKTSTGRLKSQEEALIEIHCKRCYKSINQRLERADKILDAVKKVMTRRVAELELSKGGNKYS